MKKLNVGPISPHHFPFPVFAHTFPSLKSPWRSRNKLNKYTCSFENWKDLNYENGKYAEYYRHLQKCSQKIVSVVFLSTILTITFWFSF